MTEVIAWSRDLALGYLKHPPLAAWLVAAWFTVFPLAEWSYYLLAMLMPALALWIVWRLSADYLDAEKRVVGLGAADVRAVLQFPCAQIQREHGAAAAVGGDHVLVPALVSDARRTGYAALAGLGARRLHVGKYWSVFLLAGLVVAALIDRRRARLFPLGRAVDHHRRRAHRARAASALAGRKRLRAVRLCHGRSRREAVWRAALERARLSRRLVRLCRAPVIIVVLVAARPTARRSPTCCWPEDDERRLVAAAFWAPLLLPASARSPAAPRSPRCGRCRPGRCCRWCCCRRRRRDARSRHASVCSALAVVAAARHAGRARRSSPSSRKRGGRAGWRRRDCWRSEVERAVAADRRRSRCGLSAAMPISPMALSLRRRPAARADRHAAAAGRRAQARRLARSCVLPKTRLQIARRRRSRRAGRSANWSKSTIVRNFFGLSPGKPQRYTIFIVPPSRKRRAAETKNGPAQGRARLLADARGRDQ